MVSIFLVKGLQICVYGFSEPERNHGWPYQTLFDTQPRFMFSSEGPTHSFKLSFLLITEIVFKWDTQHYTTKHTTAQEYRVYLPDPNIGPGLKRSSTRNYFFILLKKA